MTKFDYFMLRFNLFDVNQRYNLCGSAFTVSSDELRFLSAYKMLVSSAKR